MRPRPFDPDLSWWLVLPATSTALVCMVDLSLEPILILMGVWLLWLVWIALIHKR